MFATVIQLYYNLQTELLVLNISFTSATICLHTHSQCISLFLVFLVLRVHFSPLLYNVCKKISFLHLCPALLFNPILILAFLFLFLLYNSSMGSWWFQVYSQPSSTSRGKSLWLYAFFIFSFLFGELSSYLYAYIYMYM